MREGANREMPWYFSEDRTPPVLSADRHVRSKHRGGEEAGLPPRAVVFCLGKGLPVLEENFSTRLLLESLPGFITHSKVLGVPGQDGVCFLHGGYGGPQIACTVETLHVLGVRELFLAGLCGGFGTDSRVGDVLLPEKIRSEDGVSRHYGEDPEFAAVNGPASAARLPAFFRGRGFRVKAENTVTTDAVYRQTFYKEALWREMGCSAVDMEAAALVNLCNYYGMKSTVALMVSDRHPLHEGDPPWAWGSDDFGALRDRFITSCVEFHLEG